MYNNIKTMFLITNEYIFVIIKQRELFVFYKWIILGLKIFSLFF